MSVDISYPVYFSLAPSRVYCSKVCMFHTFNPNQHYSCSKSGVPSQKVKCTGWSCWKLVIRRRTSILLMLASTSHWIIKLEKLLHMEWNYQRAIQRSPSIPPHIYKPCMHETIRNNQTVGSLIERLFTVIGSISTQIVYGYWLRARLNTSDSFACPAFPCQTRHPAAAFSMEEAKFFSSTCICVSVLHAWSVVHMLHQCYMLQWCYMLHLCLYVTRSRGAFDMLHQSVFRWNCTLSPCVASIVMWEEELFGNKSFRCYILSFSVIKVLF